MTAHTKSSFASKLGFVLATAGSAVGLGNLWRFPTVAAKDGGGLFLVIYLILVFTLGYTIMTSEMALGRRTGLSALNAYKAAEPKFGFLGKLAFIVPSIILMYYVVIGGWVLEYLFVFVTGSGVDAAADGFFTSFITSPIAPLVFTLLFLALTALIIAAGVQKGIERSGKVLMPILIVLAIGIAIFSLTLSTTEADGTTRTGLEGLSILVIPNLEGLTLSSLGRTIMDAVGQAFFSLSLAMGIMVTYGSYLEKKEKLTSSVMQIAGTTFAISLLAGLMIIPSTFAALGSGDAVAQNAGPSLMFIILPQVFNSMGEAGGIIGCVFFILVIFAALTSSISLVETCTAVISDGSGCTRTRALIIAIVFTTLAGIIVNLGYSGLSFIQPLGEGTSILDFLDFISNSVMMPISAILTCIFVGWIIKPKTVADEVKVSARFSLEGAWTVMIKYVAPICIAVILVAYVAQTFGIITL